MKKIKGMQNKKLKYGTYSIVLVAIVVVIAVLLNVLVTSLSDRYNLVLDMTREKLFTLSDEAKEYVDKLDRDVTIYTTYKKGEENEIVTRALNNIQARSGKITLDNVDPILNPAFAEQFIDDKTTGIERGSVIITNADKTRYKVYSQDDLYKQDMNYSTYEYITSGYQLEQKVVSALAYICSDEIPKVYLLQGHQEPALKDMAWLRTAIEDNIYELSEINLASEGDQLTTADTLMIISPKIDLTKDEYELLESFALDGGRIMMMRDAVGETATMTYFDALAGLYEVTFDRNLVVEGDQNAFYRDAVNLVPTYSVEDEITKILQRDGRTVVLPSAGSLTLSDVDRASLETTRILTTSVDSYAKDGSSTSTAEAAGDKQGPFTVGVSVIRKNSETATKKADSHFVAYSTSAFVQDEEQFALYGNLQLLISSLNWMQDEASDIVIEAKDLTVEKLKIETESQLYLLCVVCVVVLPLLVFIVGIVVWLKRRHL